MEYVKEKTGEIESSCNMMEIGRDYRETPSEKLVYSLFREDAESDRYLICVKSKESCERGFLRGNLSQVSLLFEKITEGEVPPYILSEILEDYSKENALNLIKN